MVGTTNCGYLFSIYLHVFHHEVYMNLQNTVGCITICINHLYDTSELMKA